MALADQIKALNNAEQIPTILIAINELAVDSIEARAYVRYLFSKNWHITAPTDEWNTVLNKFYGPNVSTLTPTEYVAQTRAKILELLGEEIADPVETPKVEKPTYNKVTKKKAFRKEKINTKTRTDGITEVEGYNQLSNRMKKVIDIQRNK